MQYDSDPAVLISRVIKAEQALSESRGKTPLHFANAVRLFWSERNFLVRISFLGLLVGVLIALLIPPRYTSSVRLMPPNSRSDSSLAMVAASIANSPGSDFVAGSAGDLFNLKSSTTALMAILRSRTLADNIIQQFDLKQVYGVVRMRDARDRLGNAVGIILDRKDETITINVTDTRPERARDIANAYVDQLNRLVSVLSTSSARRERIFLESRLLQVNQDLVDAEKAFSEFASKKSAVDIKEQAKAMIGAAATLQGQLISAESELEGLRQMYSESNVRVRSLKARVAELRSQLDKLGGKDTGTTSPSELEASELYPPIRKLPLLGATYADLFRRTRVQESIYHVLTQEFELAKVEEAREIPTVKVLDAADFPEAKSYPPRSFIVGCGFVAAFTGGIVFLLVSKSWREKNPHDLSKAVVTEIWIDLKEKRFLNSQNSFRNKSGISSLLGLNHGAANYGGTSKDRYSPQGSGQPSTS